MITKLEIRQGSTNRLRRMREREREREAEMNEKSTRGEREDDGSKRVSRYGGRSRNKRGRSGEDTRAWRRVPRSSPTLSAWSRLKPSRAGLVDRQIRREIVGETFKRPSRSDAFPFAFSMRRRRDPESTPRSHATNATRLHAHACSRIASSL